MSDFIVIGGGIAGLSAGARLAELGRVTLLERESHLGYHSSGRSAALYEQSYGLPSTVALNRASGAELEALAVLSPRGLLLVGRESEAEDFAADIAAMELTEIGPDEALSHCPILDPAVVDRAAYDPGAWDIDTHGLMTRFGEMIRTNGEIRTGAEVTGITREAGLWRVTLKSGETVEAPVLVNAAGSWADGVARLAGIAPLGLTPFRRSMARIPAPEGHEVRGWPMVMGPGEGWYMKPDAGALIVSPSEEDPAEPHDAWADDMVLAEGIDRYQAYVTAEVTRLIGSWAGLRTFAPDRQLVLGPDPDEPSFLWCAGQGGYGFQTSCAASRLVASHVGGPATELSAEVVAALHPARLR
ncbi:NAD(P)/FAD-dependent oxidoreductase [Pseudoroseicyclus tamaricis]|uniref:FAD-binding oxidoreductase n=1 Tax=Pseudoroseicyclus tamaricis TaxID=2705421 RepID=A0A6B2K5U1_9RHOB|nr:FAD-dependent oxidoreductase [Pseudoroseicyclus tamaricis]NDV02176.1 FAD-binding oxidoreductase [Pseudoroseicyclus tamaricis]